MGEFSGVVTSAHLAPSLVSSSSRCVVGGEEGGGGDYPNAPECAGDNKFVSLVTHQLTAQLVPSL